MGTRKQDAYAVRVIAEDALCVIVSDGAGSASHGGQGASLLCRILSNAVREWVLDHEGLPSDDDVAGWIDQVRDHIAQVAQDRGLAKRQFAATLILMLARDGELLALQIGDSALVARKEGAWEALCWPENGEFASTTYFVTDDPEPRLRTVRIAEGYDAFAAFTDGIETLALQHSELAPHRGFFDPMIRPIDQASSSGKLRDLSGALGRFLDSAAVCERTDDDKTLVLVSRA